MKTRRHKYSQAERIAARIAGRMIIAVRAATLADGVSHTYWRGFRDGVRTMVHSLAQGHRITANIRLIDRQTKLMADLNARREKA